MVARQRVPVYLFCLRVDSFRGCGTIYYYERLADGSLQNMPNIKSNGSQIDVGYISCPALYDWNGDCLFDLVLAACDTGPFDGLSDGPNWGWVYFYRNVGTNDAPVLADPVQLYGGEELIYNYHHNICLYDWNNDGALDILSGDFNGDIRLYLADPHQGC